MSALFLSQVVHWSNVKDASGEEWFYKTRDEWEWETGLTRSNQETVRKNLVSRGFLKEELRGVPATLWFSIDREAIADAIDAADHVPHPRLRKQASRNPVGRPSANWMAGRPPTSIIQTEITSERTTQKEVAVGKPLCELFAEEETQNRDPRHSGLAITDCWNGQKSLTPIRSISKKRHASFLARLKDPFFNDNWEEAIRKMGKSDFCTGKNDRGWKADFEFFLRPDSVLKIMEGKYDNRTNGHKASGIPEHSKWDFEIPNRKN